MDKQEAKALTDAIKKLDNTFGKLVDEVKTLNRNLSLRSDIDKALNERLGSVVQQLQHGLTVNMSQTSN